ncbi:MAG: hypothetical protein D6741_06340 [Planctomycetota bacterium]|nr:MAG: hypothetical protein D6741_06340 [Planctomycetota bacterium]
MVDTGCRSRRETLIALCFLPLMMLVAGPATAPLLCADTPMPQMGKSVTDFGVSPDNSPETNHEKLQAAIDWASERGALLFVPPSSAPYRVRSGLTLRRNVSLVGANGPTGRGTRHPERAQPVGSVFAIEDADAPFITVEGATRIEGLQFWYPHQSRTDPAKIIAYPPTIRASDKTPAQGVFLSRLTFYGEFFAMDFRTRRNNCCELVTIEHCYGYPLGGRFVAIDYCYDIPRVLHCHVNPSNQRFFAGGFSRAVIDSVIARKTFAYSIDHTDNAQLVDVFTFGTYGGIRLGPATYGQLTNFNFDCVTVGIHKSGDSTKNRNWQIAQGSIIANCGEKVEDVHPIIIDGMGHTSLVNVEAFSGLNGAVTAIGRSFDFLLVEGDRKLTISLFGCRMRDYVADSPLTIRNPNAVIQAVGCLDRDENPYRYP